MFLEDREKIAPPVHFSLIAKTLEDIILTLTTTLLDHQHGFRSTTSALQLRIPSTNFHQINHHLSNTLSALCFFILYVFKWLYRCFNPLGPEFRKNSFNPAGKLQLFRSVKLIKTHGIMKITKKFTLYKIE